MKLTDRERVEGTEITIGRRVYYSGGQQVVSKRFAAEYRDDSGKQCCENLGSRSRLEARRKAIEIFSRLQEGKPRIVDSKLTIDQLADGYFSMAKAKGLAPKSEWKYRTDLGKLKEFCRQQKIVLAIHFGCEQFYRFREWLVKDKYADKTIYGVLTLTKQVLKWGHLEGKLREYRLGKASLAKAKAKPQPCFTSEQVESILVLTSGVEQAAFAALAYAGLRIGEVEQLQWADVLFDRGELGMFHVRRGGSNGSTKDKDHRFVPIHPRLRPLLEALPRTGQLVFPGITERKMLGRIKDLCEQAKLPNPQQYKLHSFRHHFASLCANHQVAHRKALAWMGHSSSEILDLYYHLSDPDSQGAMKALATATAFQLPVPSVTMTGSAATTQAVDLEGNLRAMGQSTNEKPPQVALDEQLVAVLDQITERVGFEPTNAFRGVTAFPVLLLRPLGHLSGWGLYYKAFGELDKSGRGFVIFIKNML